METHTHNAYENENRRAFSQHDKPTKYVEI